MASVMPSHVDWIQDSAVEIDPKQNSIRIGNSGSSLKYDYLVVATGIQLDWDKVEGLTEALETPGVCSNYSAATVQKTFAAIQGLQGGNAIFTFPNTPVKCAGAPQKIMYLTDAHLRKVCNCYLNPIPVSVLLSLSQPVCITCLSIFLSLCLSVSLSSSL